MTAPRRLSSSKPRSAPVAPRQPPLVERLGRAASTAVAAVARGWTPRAAPARPVTATRLATGAAPTVQRPNVSWGGGVQHNGNNPEVVDTFGRSYSSRAFAPAGVPFERGAPQQVFSSNKNLTGKPASTSLVITNPGREPLRLTLDLSVDEPSSARASQSKQLVVPPGGAVAVPIASAVRDRAFTAFRAGLAPADEASKRGRLHVDVVTHEKRATPAQLAAMPLMKTEGERGYRVPPGRLDDHPAYLTEVRYVMQAAGVRPDPVTDLRHWTPARVKTWVSEQQARGAAGQPTAFDPASNRAIQGRVNGLVGATSGSVKAAPLVASAAGLQSTVRLLPNRAPPDFLALDGAAARRPGTSLKDAGAYGKHLRATVPVKNPTNAPITLSLTLRAPPVGEDGAQLPGHQVYNGPVSVSAPGATLGKPLTSARVDQPAAGTDAHRVATLATVTVPPGKTIDVNVGLLVHANSQLPVDLVLTRTR